MKYYIRYFRMATIKKKEQKIKNVGRDVEKMEHVCTIDGDIKWMVQPLWETLKQKLFKHFKIEVSCDWQFHFSIYAQNK